MPIHEEIGDAMRLAREAFLSGDPVPEDLIRDGILKSWRRSALFGAVPDRTNLPHWDDLDQGRLSHASFPVLDTFNTRLDATATTLLLADSQSRIVRRWVGDPSIGVALDHSEAVPGVSLAEDYCGTNGVGSVIEERRALRVTGSEHWADRFVGFTCVGAPLTHPVSGQMEGVVTLVCRYQDANQLMLPLVLGITSAIEARLYDNSSQRERQLLDCFLSASRRNRRPLVVLNDRVIMTNTAAARMLDKADHALLWQQAAEAVASQSVRSTELVLGSGDVVASSCRAVKDGDQLIGVIIELTFKDGAPTATVPDQSPVPLPVPVLEPSPLDQVVGRSRSWRHVIEQARRHQHSTVPVLLTGEPGVGKLTLAVAMFGTGDTGPVTVFDAAMQPVEGLTEWVHQLCERLADPGGTVVIRHVDLLEPAAAQALCTILDGVMASPEPRMAGTVTIDPSQPTQGHPALLERFSGVRIEVPPLRERPEDIAELAEAFLLRLGVPGQHWTTEALQAMVRAEWPGNVRQMETLIRGLLSGRRSRHLTVEDLPSELRSAPQRQFSRLDKLELDAIVVALDQCGGNKSDAADLLGISRSTIYRKIRAFGLDLDRATF